MKKAIAILEFTTVSTGLKAADLLVKTAELDIIEAGAVCPGKYMIIIAGQLAAVAVATRAAQKAYGERYINSFILGNPHESLLPGFYGSTEINNLSALGVLETFDAATAIKAADTAVKTAIVELIEIRLAKGMCGKSYITLTGDVAAVTAAIEAAKQVASDAGMLLDSAVISNPDTKLAQFLL